MARRARSPSDSPACLVPGKIRPAIPLALLLDEQIALAPVLETESLCDSPPEC